MLNVSEMLETMLEHVEKNPLKPSFSEEEITSFAKVNGIPLDNVRLQKAYIKSKLALMIHSLEINPEDADISVTDIKAFAKGAGLPVDEKYLAHLDERASFERKNAFDMMFHNMEALPESRAFSVSYVRAFAKKHGLPLDEAKFQSVAAQVAAARVKEIMKKPTS